MTEPKKISLKDAINQKLQQKKQQASSQNNGMNANQGNKVLKNQNNSKPSMMRRRSGGS